VVLLFSAHSLPLNVIDRGDAYPAFGWACAVVRVEVDLDTGEVAVRVGGEAAQAEALLASMARIDAMRSTMARAGSTPEPSRLPERTSPASDASTSRTTTPRLSIVPVSASSSTGTWRTSDVSDMHDSTVGRKTSLTGRRSDACG